MCLELKANLPLCCVVATLLRHCHFAPPLPLCSAIASLLRHCHFAPPLPFALPLPLCSAIATYLLVCSAIATFLRHRLCHFAPPLPLCSAIATYLLVCCGPTLLRHCHRERKPFRAACVQKFFLARTLSLCTFELTMG